MHDLITNKFIAGALAGVVSAALVDYQAFRLWKSFAEATQYAWGTAAWRWLQGAVAGAVTAAGIAGIS